jgi:hypothetical protein
MNNSLTSDQIYKNGTMSRQCNVHFINIDSRQRDPIRDPNSNSYRIYLNTTYDNVISMQLYHALVAKTDYNIHEYNNIINVAEYAVDGVTVTASYKVTIPIGNYSAGHFAKQIKDSLTAASLASGGSFTFTVSINSTDGLTNKLSISSSGNIKLLFSTGADADKIKTTNLTYSQKNYIAHTVSARSSMGFNITDVQNWNTGAPLVLIPIVSPNKINLLGEMYVLMEVKTNSQNDPVDILESNDSENDNKFFKIPFDKEMDFVKSWDIEHTMVKYYNEPTKLTYLDIRFLTFDGNLYNFRGIDNSIVIKITTF